MERSLLKKLREMIDTRRVKAYDGIHDKFYIKFMFSHNFIERH